MVSAMADTEPDGADFMVDDGRQAMKYLDIGPADTTTNVCGDNDIGPIALGPAELEKNRESAAGDTSNDTNVEVGPMRHVGLGTFNYGDEGGNDEQLKLHSICACKLFDSAGLWAVQAATDALYRFVKELTIGPCTTTRKTWNDVEQWQYWAYPFHTDNYGTANRHRNRSQLNPQSNEDKMIAVRYSERNSNGLMFCGRTSIVRNIKLVYYERHYDGPYNDRLQDTEEKPVHAFTRFAVACYEMKMWKLGE